jgi:hypothetical protein
MQWLDFEVNFSTTREAENNFWGLLRRSGIFALETSKSRLDKWDQMRLRATASPPTTPERALINGVPIFLSTNPCLYKFLYQIEYVHCVSLLSSFYFWKWHLIKCEIVDKKLLLSSKIQIGAPFDNPFPHISDKKILSGSKKWLMWHKVKKFVWKKKLYCNELFIYLFE